MIRALIYVVLLAAVAVGAAWLADRPGEVSLTFLGYHVQTSMLFALFALFVLMVVVALVWRLIGGILGAPQAIADSMEDRRIRRRHEAMSRGLIAAAAGDPARAGRAAAEARRLAPDAPLTLLLRAQSAQVSGDRETANAAFKDMLASPETRLLGLRGLYLDARRHGEAERARRYADEAAKLAPGATWSSTALLEHQTSTQDWGGALQTLQGLAHSPLVDRATMKRHRAVLLTAQAIDLEEQDPDNAGKLAQEAHKLAPDLVPAAVVAARRASAAGDVRRATRIVETTWAKGPHPDLADIYAHARPGDSARDRLRRIRTLVRDRANHPEGLIALARAAIEAREWGEAREAIEPLARRQPTMRTCALMAEIEEGEHGDRGRVREWLARALRAPRDPAWTADGFVSDRWMPISPVTGEIDAFRWRAPAEAGTGPQLDFIAEPSAEPLQKQKPALPPAAIEDAEPVAAAPPLPASQQPAPEPAPAKAQPQAAPAAPKPESVAVAKEEMKPSPPPPEAEKSTAEAKPPVEARPSIEAKPSKPAPVAAVPARSAGNGETGAAPIPFARNGNGAHHAQPVVLPQPAAEAVDAEEADAIAARRPPDDPGIEDEREAVPAKRFGIF